MTIAEDIIRSGSFRRSMDNFNGPPRTQIILHDGTGVFMEADGSIWYRRPNGTAELLQDADSICGIGFLNTGPHDPLRPACGPHDKCYRNRAWFEERGWNREKMDDYFLDLMLVICRRHKTEGDPWARLLTIKAQEYHFLVRAFGGLAYYRHPGWDPGFVPQHQSQWVDPEIVMDEFFEEFKQDFSSEFLDTVKQLKCYKEARRQEAEKEKQGAESIGIMRSFAEAKTMADETAERFGARLGHGCNHKERWDAPRNQEGHIRYVLDDNNSLDNRARAMMCLLRDVAKGRFHGI